LATETPLSNARDWSHENQNMAMGGALIPTQTDPGDRGAQMNGRECRLFVQSNITIQFFA